MFREVLCALVTLVVLAPSALAADRTIEIHAGSRADGTMYYSPSNASANVGDSVTLRLINDDPRPHDIVLEGLQLLDIEIELEASETGQKTFRPNKPGNFTMFCELPGHEDAGMVGTLTVTGDARAPAPWWAGLVALCAIAVMWRRLPRKL